MSFITFSKKAVIPYVPAYMGNRGEETPLIVGIKPLNNDGSLDFKRHLASLEIDCGEDRDRLLKEQKDLFKERFIRQVAWVKNCSVVLSDNEIVPITTAEELWEHGDSALHSELEVAIQSHSRLSEGQLKNFVGGSGGTSLQQESAESPQSAIAAPATRPDEEIRIAETGDK